MIKIFISQPMRGCTDEEILAVREKAEEDLVNYFEKRYYDGLTNEHEFQFISSFFKDGDIEIPNVKNKSMYCLGRSLQLLADADYIYFCPGWSEARGCRAEKYIALNYGNIKLLYFNEVMAERMLNDRK